MAQPTNKSIEDVVEEMLSNFSDRSLFDIYDFDEEIQAEVKEEMTQSLTSLVQQSKEEEMKKYLFMLHAEEIVDEVDWECQCPPERRGAEIALIKMILGCSWREANEISFNSPTMSELREKIKSKLHSLSNPPLTP